MRRLFDGKRPEGCSGLTIMDGVVLGDANDCRGVYSTY